MVRGKHLSTGIVKFKLIKHRERSACERLYLQAEEKWGRQGVVEETVLMISAELTASNSDRSADSVEDSSESASDDSAEETMSSSWRDSALDLDEP
jgi:hypothetical protein